MSANRFSKRGLSLLNERGFTLSNERSFASTRQTGVTLIELVVSIVILSIAMTAVLTMFSTPMKYSADPLWRNKTLKLAQLYLDEILAKNYDHSTPVGGVPAVANPSCVSLGPETGETRETYNDVDDYHNYTHPTLGNRPRSLTSDLDGSYDNYTVSITVECDSANVVAASGTNHAKKISVSITPPGQDTFVFAAYKGNF